MKKIIPTESQEQITVFNWVAYQLGKWPELELLHHVPNGGKREAREATRMKAEGVKKGVPDLCLPVARGKYHGLYVEMKRVEGGKVSQDQKWWLEKLAEQGYKATVCRGAEEAITVIGKYMAGENDGESSKGTT